MLSNFPQPPRIWFAAQRGHTRVGVALLETSTSSSWHQLSCGTTRTLAVLRGPILTRRTLPIDAAMATHRTRDLRVSNDSESTLVQDTIPRLHVSILWMTGVASLTNDETLESRSTVLAIGPVVDANLKPAKVTRNPHLLRRSRVGRFILGPII